MRDAAAFGAACPQAAPHRTSAFMMSEDCLFLNIWRPAAATARYKLPVMVWIHGGAFVTGASNWPEYSGATLAKHGVIVVSMNYRLGWLGWFAHPDLTRESSADGTANFGLMDQIAALKWVQANIKAFNGDAGNVTLIGESAGGMSINALMTVPSAKGLFAKAISQSSAGRFPLKTLATAEATGMAIAKSLGAADLAALRALPAATVIAAKPLVPDPFLPDLIIDGTIMPELPATAFAANHEAKIPWIVATTDNEQTLFPEPMRQFTFASVPAPRRAALDTTFDPEHTSDLDVVAGNLIEDVFMTEPARFLAEAHMKSGEPTWRYVFGYVPQNARVQLKGVGHGGDIPFTLGTLGAGGVADIAVGGHAVSYTAEDHTISDELEPYLTNFAKTGDPNGTGLSAWPRDGSDDAMVFGNDGPYAKHEFRKARLDFATTLAAPTQSKL